MSIPAWINTANAEANYVIANTPNFLVRKMKEDPATRTLSQALSADDLLNGFKSSVSREPTTLRDAVIPYLCLSALARMDSVSPLVHATAIAPLPHYKWLSTYRQILVETYRSVSRQVLKPPPAVGLIIPKTHAATTRRTLQVQ